MSRAQTFDELLLLVQLCKMGRLLDVQAWVASGKPVNLPLTPDRRRRRKGPLEIAIESGFHSLVEVLLRAGAVQEEPGYSALRHALEMRRLDLVELLANYGADIKSFDMRAVFDTYSPEIIEYFIAQGADLDTGNPLAYALCERIRPALGVDKRHKDRFPCFAEQVNIALRHHCREGNLKWVALMLWAGADQYAKGPDSPDDEDPEEGISALELAALYGHLEIFKLKGIRPDPRHPVAGDVLSCACHSNEPEVLKVFLDRGFDPKRLEDRGSSLLQSLLNGMSWDFNPWSYFKTEKDIDSSRSRDAIKMIHMIVRAGARWEPDSRAIVDARRSLLKMRADYAMEFVWIMAEYGACSKESVEKLMAKPLVKELVSKHARRLDELLQSFPP